MGYYWLGELPLKINVFKKNEKFLQAKEEIKQVYLEDDRPWVVGYSGGKDSTTTVQLILSALSELEPSQRKKVIYVISSDTLVETPLIISLITKNLKKIQDQATKIGLPIETHKVQPDLEKTFWTMIIGKGYPTPRQKFRWCTDRMKIEPANKFILDKVSEHGEVVMVLGVRTSESVTRASSIRTHSIEGKKLMRHSSLKNAYVYAPIRNFTVDDVWEYLLDPDSLWGEDNRELLRLYQDSNSECPLMVDKEIKESAGSCGNSRFGCWTCTVVSEDKALSGFINNGEEWLKPLLEFRNYLVSIRSNRNLRQKVRMNGKVYLTSVLTDVKEEEYEKVREEELGDYLKKNNIDLVEVDQLKLLIETDDGLKQLGLGPFTLKARAEILRRLLETQKKVRQHTPDIELIKMEELKVIRQYWLEDGDWEDQLPKIYYEVIGERLLWDREDRPLLDQDQLSDLEKICREYNLSLSLMKKLIKIEKDYSGYKVRRGLLQVFEKLLQQDYLHI